MSDIELKKYALYNGATGVVNRFITATREMFLQVDRMPGEDETLEVDIFTIPGDYRVVEGQLVPYAPPV